MRGRGRALALLALIALGAGCGYSWRGTLPPHIRTVGVPVFANRPVFTDDQWKRMIKGLEQLGRMAAAEGLRLVYHHHTGTGVQTEQDFFGTWSGFFVLPWYGYAALYAANEIYPADALWLSLEINAGIPAGDPLIGGQFVANLFPDASYGGAVRGEMQFFEEATTDLLGDIDKYAVSASFRADPVGWRVIGLMLLSFVVGLGAAEAVAWFGYGQHLFG